MKLLLLPILFLMASQKRKHLRIAEPTKIKDEIQQKHLDYLDHLLEN